MNKIRSLMIKWARRYWYVLAAFVVALIVATAVWQHQTDLPDRSLSTVMTDIEDREVDEIVIKPYVKIIEVKLDGSSVWYETSYTDDKFGGDLATRLSEAEIDYEVEEEPLWRKVGSFLLIPAVILLFLLVPSFFMRGNNKKLGDLPKPPDTRFADVGANTEVIQELQQVVESLKDPGLYGDYLKRTNGILLYGPPGTGKTLLAQAVAGEAEVRIKFVSGPGLVANYAGQSANRINDLYREARDIVTTTDQPVLVIIDEIDAIANKRSGRDDGASQDDVKTLNALLVQFGGIDSDDNNIVTIGITNRKEVIDPALLRGGRLGQHIMVPLPDLEGRKEIIKVHLKNSDLNLDETQITTLAKLTGGMGGADIANIVNEAGQELYHKPDTSEELWDFCLEAILKVKFGPVREFPDESDINQRAAERVAAKVVVALAFPCVPDVVLVSNQCRGNSHGTVLLPTRPDDHPQSAQELFELIAFGVTGRVAEEMLRDNITSSSWHEMEDATKLAFKLVCEFGWKKEVSRPIKADAWQSDPQASEIAFAVSNIMEEAATKVRAVLAAHQRELTELTDAIRANCIVRDDILNCYAGRIQEPPQTPQRRSGFSKPEGDVS